MEKSVIVLSQSLFAAVNVVTWKSTYYQGIPNKNNISKEYCRNHTSGTFIHSVKNMLDSGIKTDKGIKLDHATFAEKEKNGLYFITGDLIAHGKTNGISWQDHIYYYLYKLTANGLTQGVWQTSECKGWYQGIVVKDASINT